MKIEVFNQGVISILREINGADAEYVFQIKGIGKRWINYKDIPLSDQTEIDYNAAQQLFHDFNYDLNIKYGCKPWEELKGLELSNVLSMNFESFLKEEAVTDCEIYFKILCGYKILKGIELSDMITEKELV